MNCTLAGRPVLSIYITPYEIPREVVAMVRSKVRLKHYALSTRTPTAAGSGVL